MINLYTFFISCVLGMDVTPGVKRKEVSPLVKLDVKKTKAMETTEINEIVQKKPIVKEINTLGKFRVDRVGVTPTFKVTTKNSAEQGGRWERIGTVIIREPGMYGRLSPESKTENILVELSLVSE